MPYFQTSKLVSRFKTALDIALDELNLSEVEAQWLHRLADEPQVPASMRVEAAINAQPASSACLIIHQRDPQLHATYLFSPLHGVQGFDNLKQLESALQAEIAHLGVATEPLQFLELTQPVFEQWSQRLIAQQTELLEDLSSSFDKLPSLRGTLNGCVTTAFATLLEGVADIPRHRLQIIAADGTVVRTDSLEQTALKLMSGESLGAGLQRQFLRGDATAVDADFNLSSEQAVLTAVAAVPGALSKGLRDYWDTRHEDAVRARREQLALALADTFVRALLQGVDNRIIDTEGLEWLRSVLLPDAAPLHVSALALVQPGSAEQTPVPLADSLVLEHSTDSHKGLYLFSASVGLQHFADLQHLERHCQTFLTPLSHPPSIAPRDLEDLRGHLALTVSLKPTDQPGFIVMADALIALVNRRVAHALRFPGAQGSVAAAAVDDALDLRALVDGRLVNLGDRARWLRPEDSPDTWGLPQPPYRSARLVAHLAHIRALVWLNQRLTNAQPNVRGTVNDLLSPGINAMTEGRQQPVDIRLQRADRVTPLIDHFLDRAGNDQTPGAATQVEVLDRAGNATAWPTSHDLEQHVEQLKADFSLVYLQRLKAFDDGQMRLGRGIFSTPHAMRTLYEGLLRLELAQASAARTIDSTLLDLLRSALDRPEQTLGNAAFRIHGLSLKMPGKSGTLTLSCAFVLQRSAPSGGNVLLWSPTQPLTEFADLQALKAQMNAAFEDPQMLYRWMELVHPEDLLKWHAPSVLPGVNIPELGLAAPQTDVFAVMADTALAFRANARRYYLGYALRSGLSSGLLQRFTDRQASLHPILKALKRVQESIERQYFQSLLPAWLAEASPARMKTYALIVQANARVANDKFNYLFGIPKIIDFANQRLSEGLLQDYPEAPSDPDLITVTFTHFTPNPVLPGQTPSPISADKVTTTKTLTEYALTHSAVIGTAASTKVTVARPDEPPLELDTRRIRALVDRLDVGNAYRTLLHETLSPQHADYQERRHRYTEVATVYLMEQAYQRFLENKLSAKAMYYVSQVLAKPDALARGSASGETISIGHLQLRAAEGFAPDPVRGMYVIGPDTSQNGPLVLYSAYRPDHTLLEFADQAALRAAILADPQLQQDILGRLPEEVRSRYDHKGFMHPHLFWDSADLLDMTPTPGAVQLVRSAIDGNAMHYLFDENIAFLHELAKARTVTTAEASWRVFRYLLGLAVEQSTFFLPGKLNAVLNTLQSVQWLKASGEAALQRQWGESLAEFITALASLAAAHLPRHSADDSVPISADPSVAVPTEMDPVWVDTLFSPSQQTHMGDLQASDVQLKDMVQSALPGLYHDARSSRYFAVVSGNVFEVVKPGDNWRIIKGAKKGPDIKPVDGQWQVDLKPGLRGGGVSASTFETDMANEDIEARFTTIVSGMKDIRTWHPLKYEMLLRAYDRGQEYLEVALENLNAANPAAPLPQRSKTILEATFAHPATDETVAHLRDYIKRILEELLSDSMKPTTSERIVIGVNMPTHRDVFGFIYAEDPGKRIFLTERLFDVNWAITVYAKPSRAELLAHQQAVTLIHELSHLTLKSVDIAYVEASAPFSDMISRQTAGGRTTYDDIREWRRNGLSLKTTDATLFKTRQDNVWRDFTEDDGRALETILRLTGTSDLPSARAAFRNDPKVRTDIILANADSLALLITRLGRKRFAVAG